MYDKQYIIYADELDKRGRYFSNFFGGVLLAASDRLKISDELNARKKHLGLTHEVKWQNVDLTFVDRYSDVIKLYFTYKSTSRLKVRIMFTQNMRVPKNLQQRHRDDQYFLRHYQFIKHAFGLRYCDYGPEQSVSVSVLPDKIPDSHDRVERFKDYLCRIPSSAYMRHTNVYIPRSAIADVNSKEHVILQGLDLLLGSICFRLNDKHKEIPPGKRRRGKRTRAKEALYKLINREIREIYPNFIVGVGTACHYGPSDRWTHPYRHRLFMPTYYELNPSMGKRATPGQPT